MPYLVLKLHLLLEDVLLRQESKKFKLIFESG